MFIKLDFLEPKKRLILRQISIKLILKTSKFARKNTFISLIIAILSIYLFRRFDFYVRHLILRYKSDIVTDFIPHGQIKEFTNKNILFWNGNKFGDIFYDDLKEIECPVSNCVFTSNRRLLTSVADYDGVMVHVDGSNDVTELPEMRDYRQIYIMSMQRSLPFINQKRRFDDNFFNMTFTYRRDSDVQWATKRFYDIKLGRIIMPSRHIKWRKPEIVRDSAVIDSIITSKTHLAVGSVPQCNNDMNLKNFIAKLREVIDIDMFNDCSSEPCSPLSSKSIPKSCLDLSSSTYKFYFAFENSNCVDYITENVFVSMQNNIIPIIFNGVTDMQHFLPPNSYINVNDFNSIKKLVKYLKFLNENPQEFANYFWWRKHYKLVQNADIYSFCDLCLAINEWDVKEVRQVYLDVDDFTDLKDCQKIDFRNLIN